MALVAIGGDRASRHASGRQRSRPEGDGRSRADPRAHRRARQENRRAPSAAYKVTIPNTTVTYGMAPRARRRVPDGIRRLRREARRAPAAPGAAGCVLDAGPRGDMGRVLDVHVRRPGEGARAPDALVDGLSRPTAPHLEMSFGRGNNGFPAISMTQHAANKFAAVAEREDRRVLPPADRGRVGVRVPRGRYDRDRPRSTGRLCVVREELGDATFCRWHLSHRSARRSRTPGGCTTCSATSWSGRWISTRPTRRRRRRIPGSSPPRPYPHAVRGGSWNDDATRVGCTVRVAVRRVVEEAGSAAAEERLVHDRRAVARLPPRASRHAAERRRDVSGAGTTASDDP